MAQESVQWFSAEKDVGFIAPYERGADIFVHHSAVDTDGFRSLEGNDPVESTAGRATTGMRAGQVRAL